MDEHIYVQDQFTSSQLGNFVSSHLRLVKVCEAATLTRRNKSRSLCFQEENVQTAIV